MVFEKIREIIASQLGKDEDEITLETNVKDDLDGDSFDVFHIIISLEHRIINMRIRDRQPSPGIWID